MMDVEQEIRNLGWEIHIKPHKDHQFIAMVVGDPIPNYDPPFLRSTLGWGNTMVEAMNDAYDFMIRTYYSAIPA